jgi:serine/threonine-protein kinase
MGEVYLAQDTRLDRSVAIKVLAARLAGDAQFRARFQREARVLASLNHPNIASIYGLEESTGRYFLVMEFVAGESLSARLERGKLSLEDTLRYGGQIADALAAAHAGGVTHRDLKPGNIMIAKSGAKVLDFGLAKSNHDEALTGSHMVMGTPAYMAPEQRAGKECDARTDIYALGLILFEMATGKRFSAETARFDGIPEGLAHVIDRCLGNDPEERWQSASDAKKELEWSLRQQKSTSTPFAQRTTRSSLVAVGAMAFVIGAMIVGGLMWTLIRKQPQRVVRSEISSQVNLPAINGSDRDLVITPDASRIVYSGNNGTQLFLRSLDQLEATTLLTAPTVVHGVFVSPDGAWIGFIEGTNTLKKIASTGGAAITVATLDGNSLGSAWNRDGSIIFATANPLTGLQRIFADRGVTDVLTHPDRDKGEADHQWPEMLPNGRGVLFTIVSLSGGLDNAQIAVYDLVDKSWKPLLRGAHHAHYLSSGHLLYAVDDTLRAVEFDLDALEVRGTSTVVATRVVTTQAGAADFSVATDGTLVYLDGPSDASGRALVWVNRQGQETPLGAPSRAYQYPRLTPDDNGVSVSITGQDSMWLWDFQSSTLRPWLGKGGNLIWTPDGRRAVFGEAGGLFIQAADGVGNAVRLTESKNIQVPTSVAPDAGSIVMHEITPNKGRDLRLVQLKEPPSTQPAADLIATRFDERNGRISPDGRWLAYESDSSGQLEIYVSRFPNVNDGVWRVSTGGGRQPVWTKKGKELIYVAPDNILTSVTVALRGTSWGAGAPRPLFERPYYSGEGIPPQYDVSVDGERFLVLKQGPADSAAPQPRIILVQNWLDVLGLSAPAR